VILCDQRMRGMSGTEFLSRVKQMDPDAVRMVLSGYTDLQSVTDAVNRGAIFKFLTKPWIEEELTEAVRDAFAEFESKRTAPAGAANG
jgi:FixJ family two-component response regulator